MKMGKWRRCLVGLTAILFCSPVLAHKKSVDLMLVLAVDVSASVTREEVVLQREGVARGLSAPEVIRRLENCNAEGIGLIYLEWSGLPAQKMVDVLVPWAHIRTQSEILKFAQSVAEIKIRHSAASTDIAMALLESADLLSSAPFDSPRKIISISGDGVQNVLFEGLPAHFNHGGSSHILLRQARDFVLSLDVRIDGVAVSRYGADTIEAYYRDHVVGGLNSALKVATDSDSYAAAIGELLALQFNNCNL